MSYVVTFHEKPYRHYKIDGERVPSVTQIIGLIDKSTPLQHYASNETIAGVIELRKRCERNGRTFPTKFDTLKSALRREELMFYDSTDRAAARGTRIHKVIEDWADRRIIPSPSDFAQHERGYLSAVAKFLANEKPEFIASEMIVGSKEHGFAGRCDTVAKFRLNGRVGRYDFKTSKRVYEESHWPQLEAYEYGAVEMGDEPTEFRAVVRLGKDGNYEVVEVAKPEVSLRLFLALVPAWNAKRELEQAVKPKKKG